jgi:hypothetical protein
MSAALDRAVASWNTFWFRPVETSSLALIRVGFALVVLGWSISIGHDVLSFFSHDGLLPAQPDYGASGDTGRWGLLGFASGHATVLGVHAALIVSAVLVLVGFGTRAASVVVFLCLVAFTRRDPWVMNSGDALLRVLALYVALAPAGAALSVDRWLEVRRSGQAFWAFPARAPWALRLIQVQLSIIYLTAFWLKSGGEAWREGTAVSYALRVGDLERLPVPGFVTSSLLLANLMTYGAMVLELAIAVLVWNRVLRPWVLLAGVALHLGIDYSIRVGFFSWAVLVCYLAFIPPTTASAWLLALRDRLTPLVGATRVGRAAGKTAGPSSGVPTDVRPG